MFRDVIDILGGFQNFILSLLIGMLLFVVIIRAVLALVQPENPFLSWYGFFLNNKRKHTVVFSLGICRTLVLVSMVCTAATYQITEMLIYVMLTVLLFAVSRRLLYILYDGIYSIGVCGIVYLLSLMHKELNKVEVQSGMLLLVICFSLLAVIAAVGQFLICANGVLSDASGRNSQEKKILHWSAILLPCLFCVLIFPYMVLTNANKVTLEADGIQFVNGEKKVITGPGQITFTENGCMISYDESSSMLDNTPIYDSGTGDMIFTDYCALVQPSLRLTNRVSPLCVLQANADGATVRNGEKSTAIEEFFLFDGIDTYYFPEGTILEWGGEQTMITSFSKVCVYFNQRIEIFTYAKSQHDVYECRDEVCIAYMSDNSRINLSTDILYRENGEEQMLFLQPMLLSDLE